jgi:aldose 1-epimerase
MEVAEVRDAITGTQSCIESNTNLMNLQKAIFSLTLAASVIACAPRPQTTEVDADTTANLSTHMKKQFFGMTPEGQEVHKYILKNVNGVEVHVINYGGIITHLIAPDKNGKLEDIVLGYDKLEGYLNESPYFGAIVGRYGNRIRNGRFSLDGETYQLAQNNNGQHLHGGINGFDKVFWNIQPDEAGLKLTYHSPDMEEGYPGNLFVTVFYRLTDDNALEIDYHATTDKKTVVNLTQHTYFNLSGSKSKNILDHELTIYADRFLPVDKTLIPEPDMTPVNGTPFDFTNPTPIGQRINDDHAQLKIAGGYDHCWVLNDPDTLKDAASLYDPSSGRYVEVITSEPGIQFYSGNFLTGSIIGKKGIRYDHRYGLCLETQHFPDSPNRSDFPSVILAPGEEYKTKTIYRFGTR